MTKICLQSKYKVKKITRLALSFVRHRWVKFPGGKKNRRTAVVFTDGLRKDIQCVFHSVSLPYYAIMHCQYSARRMEQLATIINTILYSCLLLQSDGVSPFLRV